MKRYIKFAFMAAASLIVVSCKDFLDRTPSDALETGKAIQNYTDALTALTGVYSGLQNTSYTGSVMVYYGDLQGDFLQMNQTSDRGATYYEMNYNYQNAPSIWLTPYNNIRNANNLMAAIDNGKVTDASAEEIGVVYAEALCIRALGHFNLVRVYGKPYTMAGGAASYGVPIEYTAGNPQSKPGRNSVDEVYTAIITDLTNAITLFEDGGATAKTTKNGFFNVWGAKALLARVYLYKGDNDAAFDMAKDVIENGPYELVTNADYAASWAYNANNTEIIMQIINTDTDNGDREGIGYLMSENGYACFVVSKKLRQIMDARPNDVRNTIMKPSTIESWVNKYGNQGVWLQKYLGNAGDSRIFNIPLIRLSEVYLIAAEAGLKSATADKAFAEQCLNDIVLRADPAAAELDLTIDNILLEKGIEMVGEGQRIFDLTRNNKISDRSIRWEYLFPNPDSEKFDNTYSRLLLPIPQSEIEVNPTIAEQQNPGY